MPILSARRRATRLRAQAVAACLVSLGTVSGAHAQAVLRSIHVPVPPQIDGSIGEDEWRSASAFTLRSRDGSSRCLFLFANDDEKLYVGVSAVDDLTNTTVSGMRRGFDNMAIWFRGDIGYWLYGDGRLRSDRIDARTQRMTHFPSDAAGKVTGPPAMPHMVYELAIPLKEIGVAAGGEVKVGVHYWDNYDVGPSFWWPASVNVFLADGYGRLVTGRRP